jgi:hypothetical protein
MKSAVIAAAAMLSMIFAGLTFAVDDIQPAAGTAPNFEQMKADHLKKLDDRINSLQEEKACAQAAKNPDEMKACRLKHWGEMKGHGHEMRGGRGMDTPGSKDNVPVK